MADYTEQIKLLENMARPEDLVDSFILSDIPIELRVATPLTSSQAAIMADSRKIYFSKRTYKKPGNKSGAWNSDTSSSAPGYFDDSGRFILDGRDKVTTLWLVRRGETVEGPLSSTEIKRLADSGALAGTLVKRTFDKGYVEADRLMAEIPAFYFAKSINRFISENICMESEQPEAGTDARAEDFYTEVVTMATNPKRQDSLTISGMSPKLYNFLKANAITASVGFLVHTIKNRRKADAINLLRGITGLDTVENTVLVELLVENSDVQILSDVDKDGFAINMGNRHRRSYRNK